MKEISLEHEFGFLDDPAYEAFFFFFSVHVFQRMAIL